MRLTFPVLAVMLCLLGGCAFFDVTIPAVLATVPGDGDTGVADNTDIRLTFSKPMNPLCTEEAFSLEGDNPVEGRFRWREQTLLFIPRDRLRRGQEYRLLLDGGAECVTGNNLRDAFRLRFVVGNPRRFLLTGSTPGDGKVLTSCDRIELRFNRSVDDASLMRGVEVSPSPRGNLETAGANRVTFTPQLPFAPGSQLTVTVNTKLTAKDGTPLAREETVTFRVAADGNLPEVEHISSSEAGSWSLSAAVSSVETDETVSIRFSEAIERHTLAQGISIVPYKNYEIEWLDDSSFRLSPCDPWDHGETYRLTIANSVSDLDGQGMAADVTAAFLVDGERTRPPVLTEIRHNAQVWRQNQVVTPNAGLLQNVQLCFDREMAAAAVLSAVSVTRISGAGGSGVNISRAQWNAAATELTIDLSGLSSSGTVYTIEVGTQARSAAGTKMKDRYVLYFQT